MERSRVNLLNDLGESSVKSAQTFLVVSVLCLFCLAVLAPGVLLDTPRPQEAWVLQSIHELHAGLSVVPTLNGAPLREANPLGMHFLALMPSNDILWLRLLPAALGCLLAGVAFAYTASFWGLKAGAVSFVVCATSLGLIETGSSLNPAILPCLLTVAAFLLFASCYLKGRPAWIFGLAYVLIALATLSGGWTLLAFFVFGVIALILLDLSPQRLLDIRPGFALGVVLLALIIFYLAYRIAGGPAYVPAVLSPGSDLGFFASTGAILSHTLPWLPLLVPAWIFAARPEDQEAWRDLLPAKIGFVLCLGVLWFSTHSLNAFALLGVPCMAVIIGYWIARAPQKATRITHASALLCGAITLAFLIVHHAQAAVHARALGLPSGVALTVYLTALLFFLGFVRRRRYLGAYLTVALVVLVGAWSIASLSLSPAGKAREAFVAASLAHDPLLVFENDLVLRGYLGLSGKRPILVGEDILPLGESAYLALSTRDLETLVERLEARMGVVPISRLESEKTYALLRLDPLPYPRQGSPVRQEGTIGACPFSSCALW